jgi:hypothetical protein
VKGDPWLTVTHQRWKLAVAVLGGVSGLASFAWFVGSLDDDGAVSRSLAAFAVTSGFTVGWTLLAIRCRMCGHRPVWRLWKTEHANRWVARLLTLDRCPSCGR